MGPGEPPSKLCTASNTCSLRPGCPSPATTCEELERRAIIQRNDLLLHEAVIKNDTEGVRRVLRDPVDINCRNNYGRAPIHWASSRGNLDIMEMLISANCDVEARDKYGMRPILMAAQHGHRDAVQLLINTGACSNATNKKHYTLLICAAKHNRLEVIQFLLDTLEDVNVDAVDFEGQTALFHAAMEGHTAVVKKLIDTGALLDKRNKESRSSLHVACERGHVTVVEFLLAHEVDMDGRDLAGNAPLHTAAQHQQTRCVQVLLEAGADTDPENGKGSTPLHISCSLGSRGIVEHLLQHGALINKQNMIGSTPLHMACQSNEAATVEILIGKNADLNCLNERLQSPMHIAAEMGHTEICKLLLAAGANIEQREQGGRTALYIAARGSFTAIVDMIIKTARLDYPSDEPDLLPGKKGDHHHHHIIKPILSTARQKWQHTTIDSDYDGIVVVSQHGPITATLSTTTATIAPNHHPGASTLYDSERLRAVLYKLAYRQLSPGDWKRLAAHWAFTAEQIRAIEHQYTGAGSYKEHGYRVLLIWVHGLDGAGDVNPIRELYESLTAIDKRNVADALRRKLDQENEQQLRKGQQRKCLRCCVIS